MAVLAVSLAPAEAAHMARHASGVTVQPALGGQILGYDIDRNGTEGILSEYVALGDGKNDVATEVFDQTTGKILKIVKEEKDSANDFVTYPVVGNGVGLVLYQKLGRDGLYKNIYQLVDPLKKEKISGTWKPRLGASESIASVSEDQGHRQTAVMTFDDSGNAQSKVFMTNVAGGTFGAEVTLNDSIFDFNDGPVMAFDTRTNAAVVAASIGCRSCGTEIALADLAHGTFSEFTGLGFGAVNGIAVDTAQGIACTTTEIDAGVEFYNLAQHTGFETAMAGASGQSNSGADVEYDPVNRLFLIGQPFSSTGSGSSVQVFDTKGNFVESIDGLSLPTSPALIALNPDTRTAFVVVALGTELQAFSY
jgi:hypothetical protein